MKNLLLIALVVVTGFCVVLMVELSKLAEYTIEQDRRIIDLQQDNHCKTKRLIQYDSIYGRLSNR